MPWLQSVPSGISFFYVPNTRHFLIGLGGCNFHRDENYLRLNVCVCLTHTQTVLGHMYSDTVHLFLNTATLK